MDTLGSVFPPVTALSASCMLSLHDLGYLPFGEAYQHLWLPECDEGCNSSHMLAIVSEPSPLAA